MKRLETLTKLEQKAIKEKLLSSDKFKSPVYAKINLESNNKFKEFKLSIDRKYMLLLVLTTLDYFENYPKEFETYNRYESESLIQI